MNVKVQARLVHDSELLPEWRGPKRWAIQCPFCKREHWHGAAEGERIAHCGDDVAGDQLLRAGSPEPGGSFDQVMGRWLAYGSRRLAGDYSIIDAHRRDSDHRRGPRPDLIIWDDPPSQIQFRSRAEQERLLNWYREAQSRRP